MPYAIRCKGQTIGFKVAGKHYDYGRWSIEHEITDEHKALCEQPYNMLEIHEVDGHEDPRLASEEALRLFPVALPQGGQKDTPGVEELRQEIARLHAEVESLKAQMPPSRPARAMKE